MSKPLFFKDLPVAGASHYGHIDWSKITEGARVDLVPEPDNPADPHAVAAYVGRQQIGYLARENAEIFSPLLLAKAIQVKAQIVTIDSRVERRYLGRILMACEVERVSIPT